MRLQSKRLRYLRSGFTIVEMTVALAIVSVILVATSAALQQEVERVGELQRLSYSERMVNGVFAKIEQRLEFAQGLGGVSMLADGVSGIESSSMTLSTLDGVPYEGTLIIEPGDVSEERVKFTRLVPGVNEVRGIERGVRGTKGVPHPTGSIVLWEGIARPAEEQVAPPPGTFDGQTDDMRGPVFFRGDGVGFAYRRPVDPDGTGTFIEGSEIRWGANIGGRDSVNGTAAIVFNAVAEIAESDRGRDLNGDGDTDDTFDLGRITDLGWDAVDPLNGTSSIDLVSPIFLQEQENYGGDLDGDGFDDPMFFWTPESGRLRLRMFALLGDVNGRDLVRRFETVIYLRNGTSE